MDIEESYNFYRVTERLSTSGIVRLNELKALSEQGYEVVVNLLPNTSEYAIPNEREVVESQGIEYVHIPVNFKQPASSDFLKFSETLDRVHEKKVHVHCAANYRVSAFYSLYSVSRNLWSADQAMEFITSIWQPTKFPGWSEFIEDILADVSPQQCVPTERRDGTAPVNQ